MFISSHRSLFFSNIFLPSQNPYLALCYRFILRTARPSALTTCSCPTGPREALQAAQAATGLLKSRKRAWRSDFQNFGTADSGVHERRDLVELCMFYCTTGRFSLIQPKTGPHRKSDCWSRKPQGEQSRNGGRRKSYSTSASKFSVERKRRRCAEVSIC